MTKHDNSITPPRDGQLDTILKVAVMAVGGQGGGVLTSWIETLARTQGFVCQATSVAGVAQRTGATIYYIEMAPAGVTTPVFSLAPAAGDVDIVVAAEMMEAGRAILRGFVTPDRTTLIASTHRALAISEKSVPGDGVAESAEVRAAAEVAAQKLVMLDLEQIAVMQGSVVSASLFGAMAATGRLPFDRAAFEAAIRVSGKAVDASLRAFGAAYDVASGDREVAVAPTGKQPSSGVVGPDALLKEWQALQGRVAALPDEVQDMIRAGLRKTVDFQDVGYGSAYLDRVDSVLKNDSSAQNYTLTREAAKHIANAMAYDDIIKVADLKTRATRHARIGREMGQTGDQRIKLTEYFHPRASEIAGLMPVQMGKWFEASPGKMAWLDRWFGRARHLRSDRMMGFVMLHLLGGRRLWRLKTLRHAYEIAHLEAWLSQALSYVAQDYSLAVELLRCRRLIKGYSDTHARGLSKFDRVCGATAQLSGRKDAADWIRRLREAALKDEAGEALDGALKTVGSFAKT